MGEFKKLLFIVNKRAGTGYRESLEGKILDACAHHHAECTIEYTAGRGHATELARAGLNRFDAIIAVGGDGTVNEVARALVHGNTPMGIIPKGSGNGLARHLSIPLRLESALHRLFHSQVVMMDSFLINRQLAVNVSGFGFDGHVANLFGKNKKRGFWGYAKLVLKEYLSFREFIWELHETGKQSIHTGFMVALANSSQYGNNASIAPRASVTDHFLDLGGVHKVPFHRGIPIGLRLFTRTLKNNDLYFSKKISDCRIYCAAAIPYHIDGEPCGSAQSFSIQVLPRSLKILVPNPHNI
jgi:YegS/Rv2252/BmrU family lipid kinase